MKFMNYRSSIIIAIIIGFLGYKMLTPTENNLTTIDERESIILKSVMSMMNQGHYAPKPVDDAFSKAVYKTFLERLDGNKRYFTQSDLKKFQQYETSIDDQVNARTLTFFDIVYEVYEKRMKDSKLYYDEVIALQHDFTKKESIELDGEKSVFAKDENDLKDRWRKLIKYEILTKTHAKFDKQSKPDYKGEKIAIADLYKESNNEVKKTFDTWFERMSKLRRSDRFELYISSITNYFDPHTEYFNPKEKQDFDIQMGGKVIGIGARLSQEGEYIKVVEVVVGGPVWKDKRIEQEDIIIAVTQKGGERLDITGMRVDDVVLKIRGKVGTEVILDVKKKDGSIIKVNLIREEVNTEETFAKSAIIDLNAELYNIGYIYLPKFYSSFEEGGNSCAIDVAKEIEKLKKENVNGIILDLRNNGGGSLTDVVDMTGLFIESGPIVQVKGKESRPFINQDKDKQVQFTGPIIIMVNQFSASASEIIAAAIQDYGRGIVVGSTTFGKGTVQRFYEIDRFINDREDLKPFGSLKITMQKFFRVNGGSTQHKGVVPDITLPDIYRYMDYGEKEYEYGLAYSEIDAVPFKQNVVLLEDIPYLVKQSNERVAKNNDFSLIEESALLRKKNKEMSVYPLSFNGYNDYMKKREAEYDKFKDLFSVSRENMKVKNPKEDLPNLEEASRKAKNDEWVKGLQKDIYLEETMFIMRDMIKNEKSLVAFTKGLKSTEIKN
jgi:carboxyl-terminal processing protease